MGVTKCQESAERGEGWQRAEEERGCSLADEGT